MSKVQLHAYVLAVVLCVALLAVKSSKPLAMEGRPKTDFSGIPMQIAGWSGTNGRFDERTYQGLPSCSLLVRYYVHPDYQAPVDLAIVYGTDLGDFHQPEICLEGQGLKTLEKRKITIKTRAGSFQAIRLITESDFERRAFIFWFADQGSTSTFLGDYKAKVFLHRLLARRIEPSAMVRLSTVVATTDDDAVNTIVRFVQVAFPYLQQEFQEMPSQRGG